MTVQTFCVLTPDQVTAFSAWDNDEVMLGARLMDGSSPGIGLNVNPNATGYAGGAAVTLAGNSVAPITIIQDPQYAMYDPDLVSALGLVPWATLDSDVIFAPPPPR